MKYNIHLSALVVFLFSFTAEAQKKSKLEILNTIHISSAGGWDYLAVSPVRNWLYISHGTQVNIVDKKTGDSVGVIANTTGVHGIAFDKENKKGFTSNGRLNNVFVFDINTNKVINHIETGQNPDAILYEPYSKKIITCNGRSASLSIIDPVQDKLIDSINVGGKPETAVSDGEGHLFVNIEDRNAIVQIDMKTFKVMNHWSLSPGEGPTGLAYDSKTRRLFAGCEKLLIIVNAVNGEIVDKLPIGDGCDGVAFDEQENNIYTANGEGTMTVIHENSADQFIVIENIQTKKGARTIAIDPVTHLLYLPTADFEIQANNANGRPRMLSRTFQVLVIGKK